MKHYLGCALLLASVLLSSCKKEEENPFAHPARVEEQDSGLPHLCINTPGNAAITSKEEWMEGATISLVFADGRETKLGTTKIKGRGNSTWKYPKKPYALKLDEDASLLGMPAEKRWDLLANYIDRTDMRNAVSFEVAHKTKSLDWTPHGEFVELYLNEVRQGNYYLCEHIKIDKNRLNLQKGGYLLELDTNYDEEFKFRSDSLDLPVMIKDWKGDDMTEERAAEIASEFNEIEALLVSDDRENNGWQNLVDMDSFIDWWFVYELVQCGEPKHPKSSYMYRDKGGKLKAGPVWDFDWGTFRSGGEVTIFRIKDALFYKYMFQDPSFVKRVKEKWTESKASFLSVTGFIDKTAQKIKVSVDKDKTKWAITTTVNKDEELSFDDAVATMKNNYVKHLEWMDSQISALK